MENKYLLKIGWLYPDLMSIYGDRGNIICLEKRCLWRNINVEIIKITIETKISEFENCDLLFMGGAQDKQQEVASKDLLNNKGTIIKQLIEENIPALFICGAYQFMGQYYLGGEGEKIPGLGIFDLYTKHPGFNKERCVGNIITAIQNSKFPYRVNKIKNYLVGFENHGGRTYLGKEVQPLATVIKGFGNNGTDKTEGAVYKNALGTYLHGPILPKNPHLADWLIQKALEIKYQKEITLSPLNDFLEWQTHQKALKLR